MEKLSLYDLLAFILPGGTFLVVSYYLLKISIALPSVTMGEDSVMIIPFLFISYIAGHLISIMGKWIERNILHFKTPWVKYLNDNPEEATDINTFCLSLFRKGFIDESTHEIDPHKSDILFDKIYDYLEIKGKDEKIKILMAQYGMFRNSLSIWIILSLLDVALIFSSLFGIGFNYRLPYLILFLVFTISLALFSVALLKKRKLIAMAYVYRTFLAENQQSPK